jgi:MoaA/NifB/PqqE/SkfB family radical SAM enzyme
MKSYLRKLWAYNQGVVHATLDPYGPGVARVHLVPPKPKLFGNPESVMFINGYHILPVGSSWAWIIREFLNALNEHIEMPREVSPEEVEKINSEVVKKICILYPDVKDAKEVEKDLTTIVDIIIGVAKGDPQLSQLGRGMDIREYSKHMSAPHRMDLLVSPMRVGERWHCNQRCRNCYAADLPQAEIEEGSLAPTTVWMKIIDKCRRVGIPQITFTGGEPTMRDDLIDLISYSRWFVTRLNTNGLKVDWEYAQRLYDASLDAVQITMYSHDPETHDYLVGKKGGFYQTLDGLRNCIEAGLSVSVNTPLIRLNKDYSEMLKFLKDLGVTYTGCSGLIPTGDATNTLDAGGALSNKEMFEVMSDAVEASHELGMDIQFTSPGWLTNEQLKQLGLSIPACGACLSNMAITPKGDIIPCQSWLHGETLGNFLTTPWDKIWSNPLCKKMRNMGDTEICPLSLIKKNETRSK